MSFDSQYNLNMYPEPYYHQSPTSFGVLSEHPYSIASQYAPSQENLMPSLFPPSHPDQLSQHPGECSVRGHLLSPQSWANSFHLVNLKQPAPVESSLQQPDLISHSLGVEYSHSLPNDTNAGPSSTDHVESSPMKGKRKRSASDETSDVFQGLKTCETSKIFECKLDPGCFQKFNRAEHLARHERKHTKEKPFKCHCPKAFSRLDNWRQHKQATHKLTPVANAEQEKLLIQVQKDLQRLNKMRIATIVAETRPVQIPAAKKAKGTEERKRKTKKAASLSLETNRALEVPSPEPTCVQVPQHHPYTIPPALESSDFSTSPCSSRSQGFPSSATDLSIYSSSIGSSNLDFTPQSTSSALRDYSTSLYSTPMDLNRIISFEEKPTTTPVPRLPSCSPALHPSYSLLEPFYLHPTSMEPFSYDPSSFGPPHSSVSFSDSPNVPLSYKHHLSSL